MYSKRHGLVLGFHGCEEEIALDIINHRKTFNLSDNPYDWLGHGIYFWENSPARALDFAEELKEKPERKNPINNPFVLGAVIDLGNCFDLTEHNNLLLLREAYHYFVSSVKKGYDQELPENVNSGQSSDLLLRRLDCAVINSLHKKIDETGLISYDSVRSPFFEGEELYPNAGFKEKNHIQICVRNPDCIKGYFLPRIKKII